MLQQAVAKAANTLIDEKGLEGEVHALNAAVEQMGFQCSNFQRSHLKEEGHHGGDIFLFHSLLSIGFSSSLFFSFVTALQQEVAQIESQGDLALHLPHCNVDADTPENVYPLDYRMLCSVYFCGLTRC